MIENDKNLYYLNFKPIKIVYLFNVYKCYPPNQSISNYDFE